MKRKDLLKKIAASAKKDALKRRDRRYLDTMGFLVAKGFLATNFEVLRLPNKRLQIEDAIWAGQNVEPRILEVLPAAVLRLRNHFDFDAEKHVALAAVLNALMKSQTTGPDFLGVPYKDVAVWATLPLRDRRIKPLAQKKITKTFRLSPEALRNLRDRATQHNCSETEVLEQALLKAVR